VCKTSDFVARGGRTAVVLTILGISLFAFSPSSSSAPLLQLEAASGREQNLLQAINRARAARGIPPLSAGVKLRRAARAHSRAMARSGSFTHGDWYRRLRRHGVRARTLGETIAWGVGVDGTGAAIVRMWLASPPHRSTLLSRAFRYVGVGVAVGTMDGFHGAIVATADFAG
jgi:uncharacterized protein YkwD